MLWIAILAFVSTFLIIALHFGTPSEGVLIPAGVIVSAVLLIFSLARRLTRMDSTSPWQW